jgi:prepilin-type processing-associated H-X9-DG protein
VVIAIIALLLSVIVPSLQKAKQVTRRTVCQNNLRQLSLAFRMYAEQNKDKAPDFNYADGPGSYWFFKIAPYLGTQHYSVDPEKDRRSMATMYCPVAKRLPIDRFTYIGSADSDWRIHAGSANTSYAEGSYGMNLWFTPKLSLAQVPSKDVTKCWTKYTSARGEVPILADSMWVGGWPEGDVNDKVPSNIYYGGESNIGRWCIDRHKQAVNLSFVDGHAELVGLRKLWDYRWHLKYKKNYQLPDDFPASYRNQPDGRSLRYN